MPPGVSRRRNAGAMPPPLVNRRRGRVPRRPLRGGPNRVQDFLLYVQLLLRDVALGRAQGGRLEAGKGSTIFLGAAPGQGQLAAAGALGGGGARLRPRHAPDPVPDLPRLPAELLQPAADIAAGQALVQVAQEAADLAAQVADEF